MKITIEQEILKSALRGVIKTIARSPHLPILSGILFQADSKAGKLTLTSTNLLAGVKLTCCATIDESGQFIVPGRFFSQIINSLESPSIKLVVSDQNLGVLAGSDKINLSLLTGDFPDFSVLAGESLSLSAAYLNEVVNNVGFACSQDLSRPILTGVYLAFGKKQQAVGTDGFKLSVLTIPKQAQWQLESLLISASALSDVLSLVQSYDVDGVDLVVDESGAQVNFVSSKFIYFAKVIDGNYPPFGKVMPQNFVTELEFSREEMQRALSKALLFIKESSNIIKFDIGKSEILILGQSSGGNAYEGKVTLEKFSGEAVTIAFNAAYILDFLNVITGDTVYLGINDKTKPALLRDKNQDNFDYVVMPFKAR